LLVTGGRTSRVTSSPTEGDGERDARDHDHHEGDDDQQAFATHATPAQVRSNRPPIESTGPEPGPLTIRSTTCSRVNQRASTSSAPSTVIVSSSARARKPTISPAGNGQPCEPRYVTSPTATPASS